MPTDRPSVAIVHDYLTQRGGAERVVALFAETFPGAPVLTSLYDPASTFEAFASIDVRPGVLNRVAPLRHHHRAALPLLAPWFATRRVDADVVLASSSGWAHLVHADGRVVVYCHAPARWLYQADRYVGSTAANTVRRTAARASLRVLAPPLRRADRAAARRADVYLANSTSTRAMIREQYDRDAEVLHPPPTLDAAGDRRPVQGLEPGFVLCVSRLLPYKQVDTVVGAAAGFDRPLVVVGDGPERRALEAVAPSSTRFLGVVDDATLRWCYASASVLVSVGFEDFGLAPLEAASFGVPAVARRFGGALDTVVDGVTGTLLDDVTTTAVLDAVRSLCATPPTRRTLAEHAATFGRGRFEARLRELTAP